jgi:hypothetical protein
MYRYAANIVIMPADVHREPENEKPRNTSLFFHAARIIGYDDTRNNALAT